MALITKTAYEKDSYYVDFVSRLAAGETITLVSVTSINMATGLDSTAEIIASAPAPSVSGTQVIFWYQGGAAGEEHVISARVATSNNRSLEGTVDLSVREEEQ